MVGLGVWGGVVERGGWDEMRERGRGGEGERGREGEEEGERGREMR